MGYFIYVVARKVPGGISLDLVFARKFRLAAELMWKKFATRVMVGDLDGYPPL